VAVEADREEVGVGGRSPFGDRVDVVDLVGGAGASVGNAAFAKRMGGTVGGDDATVRGVVAVGADHAGGVRLELRGGIVGTEIFDPHLGHFLQARRMR
jgi:hypothetical protein